MSESVNGPGLVCPGCGSRDVSLDRGMLCGSCADAVPAPALCLCAHTADVHPWGPCLAPLCGCGWYRPDLRGWTGQQEAESA